MKKVFCVIMTVNMLIISRMSFAIDCNNARLGKFEYRDGTKKELVISSEKIKSAPKWSPGENEPPLSISNALRIATSWAKKKHSNFDDIGLGNIRLSGNNCWASQGHWFYEISFYPLMGGKRVGGSYLFFAVLMDGTVVEPILIK